MCEIAPPRHRGVLASTVQVLITVGLITGYFMCYGTATISSSLSWRLPLAFQAGFALVLALMANFCLPQSPRLLAFKGRGQEASVVWDRLGVANAEREKELEQRPILREAVEVARGAKAGLVERMRQSVGNLMAMFGKKTGNQMLLGVFLMSIQQMSGIDGVLYVCIFAPAPWNPTDTKSTRLSSSSKLASPPQKRPSSPLASPLSSSASRPS